MHQPGKQKLGFPHLAVVRGGWAGRPEPTPEEWVERKLQEWAARGRVHSEFNREQYATRAIENIAYRASKPGRVPARTIRGGLDKGLPLAWACEFGEIMTEYAVRRARANGRLIEVPDAA